MVISPAALALGLPPIGAGVYDPTRRRGERWAFRAVAPERAQAGDWCFVGPEQSRPENYIDGAIRRLGAGIGPLTPGVIFDPENGWPQIHASERAAKFSEMAWHLAQLAARTRVCITSHGGFPVAAIPRWLRKLVSGSPQLYYDAPTNARVLARWQAVFGERISPSIAGPRGIANPPPEWSTDEGYQRYLDGIPRDVPGVIIWDLTTIRPSAYEMIRSRWGRLATFPAVATAAFDTLPVMGIVLIVLAMLVLTFVGRNL